MRINLFQRGYQHINVQNGKGKTFQTIKKINKISQGTSLKIRRFPEVLKVHFLTQRYNFRFEIAGIDNNINLKADNSRGRVSS